MPSSRNRLARIVLSSVLIGLTIAYPLAFFFLDVPPFVFVIAACALLAVRAVLGSSGWGITLRWLAFAAIVVLAGLTLVDTQIAALAYPVVISSGLGLLFVGSLVRPPSLVERIAILSGDELTPQGRLYCRRVTMVWAIWLTLNAAITTGLAIAGSVAAWALWTGLLSYLIMGLIFVVEFCLRRRHRERHAT
jgi:uncharacterized membrane protein